MMNIWHKDKTVADNLECDVCGYRHDKPDVWAIVVECADGINRCKVCRGEAKFNTGAKKIAKAKVTP